MSVVSLEAFVREHAGEPMEDVFAAFLDEPRIQQWVGADEGRRRRIRDEFERAWRAANPPAAAQKPASPAVTMAPVPRPAARAPPREPLRVDVEEERHSPRAVRPFAAGTAMCPVCGSLALRSATAGDRVVVQCAGCGTVHEDLLALVPVRRVGPFAYVFGEGLEGAATVGGILGALALVYAALRFLA